jgi:anti-sigma factor RsiW
LIAFLYGELNDAGSQAFQQHMQDCSLCSGELAAFSNIRSSVVAWRNESLGGISSPAITPDAAPIAVIRENPSALVALRAFFNLSPLWMKGAVAFATLLFCLFAGLSVARLRNTPIAPVADNAASPNSGAYSDQKLNALVEQRVQDELQRIKISTDELPASQVVKDRPSSGVAVRRMATRGDAVATSSPGRRPLTKVEREQLAADLRLVAVNNDSELDLLDDRINQ